MSDELTPFTRLGGVLRQMGMLAELIKPNEQSAFEQLFVSLDKDLTPEEESRYVMQLFFSSDVLAAAQAELEQARDEDATAVLQFIMSLDMQVKPEQMLEVYRLFSVFNRLLPAGAFDLTEEDIVYLRYSLVAENKREITIPQVVEVLDMIGFFIRHMAPGIESLINGKQNREQVIETIERSLMQEASAGMN